MAKRILFLVLIVFCLACIISYAESIDVSRLKTEDLKLEKGNNVSLELNPGAPFSIRMYAGSTVDFDIDNKNYLIIFDSFGDVATVRYTTDGGKTFIQRKIKLGDSERVNTSSESWFFYLNYKIYNQRDSAAVVEVGKPLLQRYNVPIQVNNTEERNGRENNNTPLESMVPQEEKKTDNNYMKYLVGIIIVLIIIIIVLGPRKKEIVKKKFKEAVEKISGRKKKGAVSKAYYKKPRKKGFDEEDVYVVKESEE